MKQTGKIDLLLLIMAWLGAAFLLALFQSLWSYASAVLETALSM